MEVGVGRPSVHEWLVFRGREASMVDGMGVGVVWPAIYRRAILRDSMCGGIGVGVVVGVASLPMYQWAILRDSMVDMCGGIGVCVVVGVASLPMHQWAIVMSREVTIDGRRDGRGHDEPWRLDAEVVAIATV